MRLWHFETDSDHSNTDLVRFDCWPWWEGGPKGLLESYQFVTSENLIYNILVVSSYFFWIFTPKFGEKIRNLTNPLFEISWNHQPDKALPYFIVLIGVYRVFGWVGKVTSDRIGFFEIVSLEKMCQISLTLSILTPQKCLFWEPGPLWTPAIQVQTPPLEGPWGSLGKLALLFLFGRIFLVVSSLLFTGEIWGRVTCWDLLICNLDWSGDFVAFYR